jgi:glutathione S-transferase
LIDQQIRLADVAIFPFIRQFAAVDSDWFRQNAHPVLQHWLAQMIQTSPFKSVMEKYSPWRSDEAILIWGAKQDSASNQH